VPDTSLDKLNYIIDFFKSCLNLPFKLKINDNRHTIISTRKNKGFLSISIHRRFLDVEKKVLGALADFIKDPSKRSTVLKDFVKINFTDRSKAKDVKLKTEGRYYNPKELFDRINEKYFENKIEARIGWGRLSRKTARKIFLGNCRLKTRIIVINPLLDSQDIPSYFLEFIIYHEMLHLFLGFEEKNGRRYAHTSTFRALEKRFEYYEKAKEFEKRFFKG